ncbi:hypothetical protein Bbelb_048380 [Branchiostoma belcheri]|nr:hypothetical protein Bbelb_048380 [Branchiostoma belcheri]
MPLTSVAEIERKINKHLRRWLGVPPSFTAIGLYTKAGQMQLPLSSVEEEYKVAKCRTVMLYRDSHDQKVRDAGVTTRAGRRFKADSLVDQAEGMLVLRDIIGITNIGRQGLGSTHFQQWGKANREERRSLVQEEVRKLEEEKRIAKATQMATQGAWTKWNLPSKKISWADLWNLEPYRISFMLRSVYDTLPSPSNLYRWGLREDPACKLCGERGTMAHILSSCKTALAQGRYRWRHDKVLTVLASSLEEARKRKRQGGTKPGSTIAFVREGERRTITGRSREVGNILEKANTWELRVDLGRKLQFPKVVQTNLRPDAVLWAEAEKKIVLIELTVPWEERCEEAYERKKNKYQELIDECRSKGWQAWLFPVEVGCRGFPARSVWKLFTAIGVKGKERKVAVRKLVEEKKVAGSLAERMCSELAATAGPNNSRASRLRVETPKEELTTPHCTDTGSESTPYAIKCAQSRASRGPWWDCTAHMDPDRTGKKGTDRMKMRLRLTPDVLPPPGQPRENCDKTDVFTWNMGLVIPEVFIRINMSASQPETPENTISP